MVPNPSSPALSPICAYVSERTGSSLSAQQLERLKEALSKRLKGQSEEQYLAYLKTAPGAAELGELMSAVSVHKTDLFRDEVQLGAFGEQVLRPMVASARRPLRLWSAGCATGEEVATLLILLAEAGADPGSTVLGTDLAPKALEEAKRLSFDRMLMGRVPAPLRARWFKEEGRRFTLVERLRGQASFLCHNLIDASYPVAKGGQGFDVIFCRNVLIYFTESAFDRVVTRLGEQLSSGGVLVLSSAEPIFRAQPGLQTLRCGQAFFYQRAPAAAPIPTLSGWPGAVASGGDSGRPAAAIPNAEPPPRPPPPRPPPPPDPAREAPRDEAVRLFQLVLEWASAGEPEAQTEEGLRRCLYLDQNFAQARYLLAMLLEQRGAKADATSEYRRALASLNEGKSQVTPFFLNDQRLKVACASALQRLGYQR